MAETPSSMIPLGTKAPDFILLDTITNRQISLDELKSPIATVIMFLCNHCPYVKNIQTKLVEVASIYQQKGINFVAISSNDATKYPADDPMHMRKEANDHHYPFPYLYDETQKVAKDYHAACTPDFFIFDNNLLCLYRGRFDDSTPGNQKMPSGADLIRALENITMGKPVDEDQKPSLGCNIKWKR